MTTLQLLVIFTLTQLGNPHTDTTNTAELRALAESALKRVEKMREQRLSKPLKMGVKSRDEILTFIQRRLAEEYGPDKVQAEGWLLEDQGLLPAQTDYVSLISKLLMEQVAGFYDHTRQELYIADWLDPFVQGPVMAHVIFHALQDQEWGAGKLLDSKVYSHDQILAHAALLEGDANRDVELRSTREGWDRYGDIKTDAQHGCRQSSPSNVEPAVPNDGQCPRLCEVQPHFSVPKGSPIRGCTSTEWFFQSAPQRGIP